MEVGPRVPSISSASLPLHEMQAFPAPTPVCACVSGELCTWGSFWGGLSTELTAPPAQLACVPLGLTGPQALTRLSVLSTPVPFREAPAYSNRRRRPPSTLAAPRVLLRSNSDNNLNSNVPDWAVCPAAHRSLSPQLLQQVPGKADGAARTIGSYAPGPRSRSPSLNRLGGASEDGQRPQQPWHVG